VTESNGRGVHQRSDHPIYLELHDSPEFVELRKKFRAFVLPATIVFMAWYLLYVVLSMWAHDFMSTKIVGNVNVAVIFGLLQFVSTFLIAWLYGRYMNTNADPLARELQHRYDIELGGGGGVVR
jgi:uncharacterized membrane protein (DUF485 family)